MNCEQATIVWRAESFTDGLEQAFPGALDYFDRLVKNAQNKERNKYMNQVAELLPSQPRVEAWYVEHGEDDDPFFEDIHSIVGDKTASSMLGEYFQKKYNLSEKPQFDNFCCKSCRVSIPKPDQSDWETLDEQIAFQKAAVRIDPDGNLLW